MEYCLEEDENKTPFFIFIIDTCLADNEFQAMINGLTTRLEGMSRAYVALITVSQHVYLHDLASPFLRETIIGGNTAYTQEQLMTKLNMKPALQGHA